MRGHGRQHRVILRERLLEPPERRERIAAIGERARKARRQRERRVERRQRLGGPVELRAARCRDW